MGLWWRVRAYRLWVIRVLAILFRVSCYLGSLGVAIWLQSGWGSHIRLFTAWVSERVAEMAHSFVPGIESAVFKEVIEAAFFIWDHLKGPLAELVIAAVTLGVRCIVFVGLYVIAGIFSVIFIVVGYVAGYAAHVVQEGRHLFCLDACRAAWGEIACIILCRGPSL